MEIALHPWYLAFAWRDQTGSFTHVSGAPAARFDELRCFVVEAPAAAG